MLPRRPSGRRWIPLISTLGILAFLTYMNVTVRECPCDGFDEHLGCSAVYGWPMRTQYRHFTVRFDAVPKSIPDDAEVEWVAGGVVGNALIGAGIAFGAYRRGHRPDTPAPAAR